MKTITLRNLPPHLWRAILQRARRQRTSATRAVISWLEDSLPRSQKGPDGLYHDLDHMIGAINEQEAQRQNEALAEQRTIDDETWK